MKKNRKVETAFQKVCKKYGIESGKFTKDDFYRICQSEKIHLLDNKTEATIGILEIKSVRGMCITTKADAVFIYLRSFFVGRFSRKTAFHELGHYFLRHGSAYLDNGRFAEDSEKETEADYFAYLATGLKDKKAGF